MEHLLTRWNSSQVQAVLADFKSNRVPVSPFGLTADGRIDLRGISLNLPLILNGLVATGVDLSFAKLSKLLLIKSTISDWNFDNSQLTLLNNASKIYRASFNEAKLATSGSVGGAEFVECSFICTDLIGGIFKEGVFQECIFSEASLKKVEFGSTTIRNSKIVGTLSKCFFRGCLRECDLTDAIFLDCAFYGVLFSDCTVSEHVLIVKNWVNFFETVRTKSDLNSLSLNSRKALNKWCGVWLELAYVIEQNLIDYRDIEKSEGVQVAEELFRLFKSIDMQ